jgi:hypothetical protein
LSNKLRLALPIACVDGLDELSEVRESGWFPYAGDLIFVAIGKTIVKVVPEGTFSIASDLRSDPIELHDILGDPLTIFH